MTIDYLCRICAIAGTHCFIHPSVYLIMWLLTAEPLIGAGFLLSFQYLCGMTFVLLCLTVWDWRVLKSISIISYFPKLIPSLLPSLVFSYSFIVIYVLVLSIISFFKMKGCPAPSPGTALPTF